MLSVIFTALILGSIQSIVAIEPKFHEGNLEELYSITNALVSEGRFQESLVYIDKILEIEPNNVDAEKLRFQVTMKMLTLDAILDLEKSKIKDKTMYGKFTPTKNFVHPTKNNNQSSNPEYDVHVLVVVRNTAGQLVNVSESTSSWYLPDKLTDAVFDYILDGKEITTINNIRYEKAQHVENLDFPDMSLLSTYPLNYCEQLPKQGVTCIPVFFAHTSGLILDENYVATTYWTILRIIN